MQHPDEGTIHAWIDGELSAEEAATLEAHLKECAECSALVAEARGFVAASSRIVSALDIVPGDVIPKTAPRRKAWYASTQLRAAAAVVIVAGASLLVMKNGGQTKMKRVMETSAPVTTPAGVPIQQAAVDSAASQSLAAPVVAEAPATSAKESAPKKTSEGTSRLDTKKGVASDAAKPLTPQAAVTNPVVGQNELARKVSGLKAVPSLDSAQRRRFSSTTQLDEVVVTGVAVANAPVELKKLRTDSAKRETVYEVSPGVQVTLTDNGVRSEMALRVSAQTKERQSAAAAPAPPPTAAPATADAVAKTVINSITWTDKRGHVMVLRGAVPKDDLEAIRKRLPPDQR